MIAKNINLERLSPKLQQQIGQFYEHESDHTKYLTTNQVYCGDSQDLLEQVRPNSIAFVTREDVLAVVEMYPDYNRHTLYHNLDRLEEIERALA